MCDPSAYQILSGPSGPALAPDFRLPKTSTVTLAFWLAKDSLSIFEKVNYTLSIIILFSWMSKILLLCLILAAALFSQPADTSSEILGVFKFENLLQDRQFNGFHDYLSGKLEHELKCGLVVKSRPLPFSNFFEDDSAKQQNIRIALFGTFSRSKDSIPMLNFKIMDLKVGNIQEKIITMSDMEKEDIAQIILLKLKDFLEESMLGRLNIISLPLGMEITLDQKSVGTTPKEIFLKTGRYSVELSGKYLVPYKDKIEMAPGKTVNIKANMEFKGYPTSLWVIGSAATTWELMVIWVLEKGLYQDYRSSFDNLSPTGKEVAYDHYNHARYLRVALLGLAGMGWLGSGFCYLSNKNLKKRYFDKIE
jgi:hypothetical protein